MKRSLIYLGGNFRECGYCQHLVKVKGCHPHLTSTVPVCKKCKKMIRKKQKVLVTPYRKEALLELVGK